MSNITEEVLNKKLEKDGYNDSHTIKTTKEQDKLAIKKGEQVKKQGYCLIGNNCKDFAKDVLDAAGVKNKDKLTPNDYLDQLKKDHPNKKKESGRSNGKKENGFSNGKKENGFSNGKKGCK